MSSNPKPSEVVAFVKHIPGLDVEYAINTIGDSEIFVKMLLQMTRIMPSNIKLMDDCLTGNADLSLFRVKVHGVKGALRQAGHLLLARSAELLEKEAAAGNVVYCKEHYYPFKDDLLCFLDQLNNICRHTEADTPAEIADIGEYTDTLAQIKTAIENFDSLLAAELLIPLAAKHFGGITDTIIASICDELEKYRPEAALEYIQKLV